MKDYIPQNSSSAAEHRLTPEDAKPQYETPAVLSLGGLTKGQAQACSTGSQVDPGGGCHEGFGAQWGGGCSSGTGAVALLGCHPGTSANSGCYPGNSPTRWCVTGSGV